MSDPSGENSGASGDPSLGGQAKDSEDSSHPKAPRRRGIYLLPNLFTTAALFSGFYAIVAATGGRYESAAIAIFVAMVLDGIDGRIARMTGTQSVFGAEYDSLSDVISFGLAPSLLLYESVLSGMGKPGWVAAFFYTAATALRLARFNVQVGSTDKNHFQGLPCPAAAAVLAGLVWFVGDHDLLGPGVAPFAFAITIATGALMVSRFRFHSFKNLDLRGQVPFSAIFAVVLLFVLVSSDPPLVLFLGAMAYAASGPLLTLLSLRRRRARRRSMPSSSYDIDRG